MRDNHESAVPAGDPLVSFFSALEMWGDVRLREYQREIVVRRLSARMQRLGLDNLDAYREHIAASAEERARVCEPVSIQQTGFFRDPERWAELEAHVVPSLLARIASGKRVRAWSAGCATGEEAYTLAMVMAEAVGVERAREHVSILATDVSPDALAVARQGVYGADRALRIPDALRAKYFERRDDTFVVTPALRALVCFSRHDLLVDPPFPRLDLVVCRNTLLYFQDEVRGRVLSGFHLVLEREGHLFCGPADGLPLWRRLFVRVQPPAFLYRLRPEARATAVMLYHGRRAWPDVVR